MPLRAIAAVGSALLLIVGVALLFVWARNADERAMGGVEPASAYQVTQDIPANASLDTVEANVELRSFPASAVPSGAVTDLSQLVGLRSTVSLIEGEILVRARFNEQGIDTATDASVPEGLQEFSVILSLSEAAGGAITPGSKVGVIALFEGTQFSEESSVRVLRSRLIAQEVLVTRVVDSEDGQTSVFTLAVNSRQAAEFALAEEFGAVRLTAQNDNTVIDGGNTVDARELLP